MIWSVCIRDASGHVVLEQEPDRVLRTASVGKILLLLETARELEAGALDPTTPLRRPPEERIGDSGLWHLLAVESLPLADVATLVGAVSDNVATNVLLDHVGLERVSALAEGLGLEHTRLLDRVRASRGSSVPPTLSTGTATELSLLCHRLATGTAVSATADAMVVGWLSANADLSLVAGGFGLDPLAHRPADEPSVLLWNKTGSDSGIRADVGSAERGRLAYRWAVLANWTPTATDRAPEVVARMRALGDDLASRLLG